MGRFSRRGFVGGAGLAVGGLVAPAIVTSAAAQARRIVLRDTGVGTAFTDAFTKPFTRATGIEVISVVAQAEPTGQVRQMVDSGSYVWDMAVLSQQAVAQLTIEKGGYLEPLGIEGSPVWDSLPDAFKTPYFAANDVVASVLAYRTDKGLKIPRSWADFWNVQEFPGNRAMRRFPQETLEYALLADGVAPKDVYPLDADRAFKSLDKIKPNIAVWWTSGAQTSQLLQSAEVDYCTTWNGRVQPLIDAGSPLAIMWEQAIWGSEGWAILKGTPKADLCREFIKFALQPERQAAFAGATGYGPTQPAALGFVPHDRVAAMPTNPVNVRSPVYTDPAYWAKNQSTIVDRFNRWIMV